MWTRNGRPGGKKVVIDLEPGEEFQAEYVIGKLWQYMVSRAKPRGKFESDQVYLYGRTLAVGRYALMVIWAKMNEEVYRPSRRLNFNWLEVRFMQDFLRKTESSACAATLFYSMGAMSGDPNSVDCNAAGMHPDAYELTMGSRRSGGAYVPEVVHLFGSVRGC